MHQSTVADRREHGGKRNLLPQNRGAQIAIFHGYCLVRPENDVLKGATIFAERDLGVSAAVQIIKDSSGHSAFRDTAKVSNVQHAGGRQFAHFAVVKTMNLAAQERCAQLDIEDSEGHPNHLYFSVLSRLP